MLRENIKGRNVQINFFSSPGYIRVDWCGNLCGDIVRSVLCYRVFRDISRDSRMLWVLFTLKQPVRQSVLATCTALFGLAPVHKKALSTDSVSASALARWQNFVAPQQTNFFTVFTSVNKIIDYSIGND